MIESITIYQQDVVLISEELADDIDIIERLEIIEVGVPGSPGPPGLDGTGAAFEQTFIAAMSWTVNHNLGREPIISLLSLGGAKISGTVLHTSLNQFIVYWALLTAGRVRCL